VRAGRGGGEGRKIERAFEGETQLSAGDGGRGGENEEGGVGLFEGALQAIYHVVAGIRRRSRAAA